MGDTISTPEWHIKQVLIGLGQDVEREGLQQTPSRYIKFLREFLQPSPFTFTTFENEGTDEMIIVENIPFFSLCEHHIVPFYGTASVAYIPNDRIVGLSKIPRCVDYFSNRLQNQERITSQIAFKLEEELRPKGVAVVLKAQHLCMHMRGVKKHDTWTKTSKLTGVFKEDSKCRAEFLQLIH